MTKSTQISDMHANIIHHIEYMPYGEAFVEQRSNWGTNYKFNGKELDEETGFYYYGARYYNPDISIWLSVDPLSDKYPSLSPYNYCANNPIKYVDPDGMKIEIYCPEKNKTYKYNPNMKVRNRHSKFVSDAITGLNFLYNNPEGGLNRVDYIANSDISVTLNQQSNSGEPSRYSGVNRVLSWDNLNSDIYENGAQSPIVSLAHEIDHAFISVQGWEKMYLYESNKETYNVNYPKSVSEAYMYNDDPQAPKWEESAMKYENFIGGKTVNGKQLSTHVRTEYVPPQNQSKVNSIFDIE